ncbi:glutamate receptor 4-like isoform X2 [Mya arenaria]|uniref:glutamate receptor 4-like isoform X2 n=1 Tax=Mya arenaria TaxID=6604 RepID=UPI0022E760DB|nr:glutamate receptor 4-like isoform X2 [Mya arenaria]
MMISNCFGMKNIFTVSFLGYVLLNFDCVSAFTETVLNAVILGHKGHVNASRFQQISEALSASRNTSYCRVNFTTVEYDTTNGSAVYSSLKHARATFEDTRMTVAIGPQIDVFTSPDYVIMHQIHFVTSSGLLMDPGDRTLPILPDPKSLSNAIAEIVGFLEWNKVAFLSQEDFSPVLALGGKNVFVSPIRLPSHITSSNNPQLKATLTTLRESQMDKFILHSMDKNVVKHVLIAAQDLHLLHHSIRWFITYLDFDEIASEIVGVAKVYGLQLLEKDNFPKEIDGLFKNELSRLERGLMGDVIGILHHYLRAHAQDCLDEPDENNTMSAEQFKEALKNEVDSYTGALGNYIWPKGSKDVSNIRNEYSIYIYRYIGRMLKFGQVIFQRKSQHPRVINYISKEEPHVPEPFKDKYFTVIAKMDEPFVMRTGRPWPNDYEGFCVDVLRELSRLLNNFNYSIIEPDVSRAKANGKSVWDDIINQLKIGNASMAIGAFAVTAAREATISFSYTIISSSVSLLLRRPPDTVNYFQFLGPFSWRLWLLIIGFVLVVGFGLFFMARFDSTQNGSSQRFDLKESIWYATTVLLQGSSEYSPQTTCMRTIVAFFWFCTLVINAAYTANLAAFLTLQQNDDRIKSVDHLARQIKVKYGVLNNSDLMEFFKKSRDDPYERMWTFMKLNEAVSILPERAFGVKSVLEKDNYIYLDDGVINNYMAQSNCELESIEQNFGVKHFSMGLPKGAPYRGDINRALLKLKEDGTLDRLRNKWWSSSTNCTRDQVTKTKTNTASELNISNMFGVFIVLIGFTVLAIIYEITIFAWKLVRDSRNKKSNGVDEGLKRNSLPFLPSQPSIEH